MKKFLMHRIHSLKGKEHYAIVVLFALIAVLFILVLKVSFFEAAKERIVTVDVVKIINDYTKHHAKQNLSQESQEKVKKAAGEFAYHLEHTLNNIAIKNHWILVPKQAVIAGAPDITEQVEKLVMELS